MRGSRHETVVGGAVVSAEPWVLFGTIWECWVFQGDLARVRVSTDGENCWVDHIQRREGVPQGVAAVVAKVLAEAATIPAAPRDGEVQP